MKRFSQISAGIVAVALAVSCFFLGYLLAPQAPGLLHPPSTMNFTPEQWGLFSEVTDLIYRDYLEKTITGTTLMNGALRGMVNSLGDPYSQYLTPVDYTDWTTQITGIYGGVGMEIGSKDDKPTVISVFPGTPAERAGIRSGDHFIKVDDVFVEGLSVNEIASKVRGDPGTDVKLVLERTGEMKEYTLKREQIIIQSANGRILQGSIGYIQLLGFKEQTAKDFAQILEQLTRQGMSKLILDLRQNPGGLLSSVIDLASSLVPTGQTIVIIEDRDGQKKFSYSNPFTPKYSMPIVLLVDGGTASAAEILAGALRDNQLATLIGERTFGKGIVQTVEQLPQGGALIITTQRYLTPSGESIHKKGIMPDQEIQTTAEDQAAGRDPVLERAIQQLTGVTP